MPARAMSSSPGYLGQASAPYSEALASDPREPLFFHNRAWLTVKESTNKALAISAPLSVSIRALPSPITTAAPARTPRENSTGPLRLQRSTALRCQVGPDFQQSRYAFSTRENTTGPLPTSTRPCISTSGCGRLQQPRPGVSGRTGSTRRCRSRRPSSSIQLRPGYFNRSIAFMRQGNGPGPRPTKEGPPARSALGQGISFRSRSFACGLAAFVKRKLLIPHLFFLRGKAYARNSTVCGHVFLPGPRESVAARRRSGKPQRASGRQEEFGARAWADWNNGVVLRLLPHTAKGERKMERSR